MYLKKFFNFTINAFDLWSILYFWIGEISPNVCFLPKGIKIGSYPKPFFPLILFEIEPSIFPMTLAIILSK